MTIPSESRAWDDVRLKAQNIVLMAERLERIYGMKSDPVLEQLVHYAHEIVRLAYRGYSYAKKGLHQNPPLVVFANPGNRRTEVKSVGIHKVGCLSHEVHSVAYRHCDDGEPYQHDFERPTDLIACKTDDGRKVLVILNPDGEPVWEDFS